MKNMLTPASRWRKARVSLQRTLYGKTYSSGPTAKAKSTEFASHLPFASLILYVVVSIASTTDTVLLKGNQGFRLPVVGIDISVFGFYIAAPIIILVAHLVTTKRVAEESQKHVQPTARNIGSFLDTFTERLLLALLMFAGPGAILFATLRFASYQHRAVFLLHTGIFLLSIAVSCIRYKELVQAFRTKTSRIEKAAGWLCGILFSAYWAVCFDVIFVPPHYSVTLLLKTETDWLDDEDGGTIALIPHIKIDRAAKLWDGNTSAGPEDPRFIGFSDKDSAFMNRSVVLDLRGKRLRFLDLHSQIVPRIWAHDADLSGANLSFSRLYGSVFVNTQFYGVNFDFAALDGATFMYLRVVRSSFNNSRLRGIYWDGSQIEQTTMYGADLALSSFFGTTFKESKIVDSMLTAISVDSLNTFNDVILNSKNSSRVFPIFKPMDDSGEIDKNLFSVDSQKVAGAIIETVCKSPSDIGSRYAWNMFSQLEVLRTIPLLNEERSDILKRVLSSDSCNSLPDRGLREILASSSGRVAPRHP
ncbi:MAG: hypothetical protein H6R07_1232 [Proteobacteria bacterium]|nr:hypothetical protein [Pseudomonadota bacterium]